MKRTPLAFFLASLLIYVGIAFLNLIARDGTADLHPSVKWLGDLLVGRASWCIFLLAASAAIVQLAERVFSTLQFRKEKIQNILDHMVRDLFENKPKERRCTLFRAAKGYQVAIIVLWRAIIHHSGDRLTQMRAALLNPFGTYLYVWARAKGSRNHRSCVAFRVHSRYETRCEGMAGTVWFKGVYQKSNLPQLEPDNVKDLDDLSRLPADDLAVRYARASNISSAHQLKARARFAKHFYGSVIESPKTQEKWGVLLVDATDRDCPWPTTNRSNAAAKLKDFEKEFESFTVILSNILT
ncbi:MAG: hypothetical protein IT360_25360 [Gemmatimonadaceae bacterium]|nr:hypothetical protein [Gemmatimonadaceae bacterium]